MPASLFFYDLETSGFDPKCARIMQFAGQRTDMDLKPLGDPVNTLIKLTPDALPDPDAVLVTGITPQATQTDGVTEAEFLKLFSETIATPGTTFLGYNSVRFDDEFMRYLHYRNFYDAYEWQWCDNCSRWDMLDVVRMTRALRPEGITWPFNPDGSQSNRLEFITKVNGLDHANAHDALSDVRATIAAAQLISIKQPKLFQFMYDMRDKKKVAALAESRQPFVYTSGSYAAETYKTTVAIMVAPAPNQGALVYDLRYNPEPLVALSANDLAKHMRWQPRGVKRPPFPVKTLRYNRCPAVAPASVLDAASKERLQLDMKAIEAHRHKLEALPDFVKRLTEAGAIIDKERGQTALVGNEQSVDGQLYDGFLGDQDKRELRALRAAPPEDLPSFKTAFKDARLQALLPLYQARNYPNALDAQERAAWEQFCAHRLMDGGPKSRMAKYFDRLQQLAAMPGRTTEEQYLLEELQLYGESLMPAEPSA